MSRVSLVLGIKGMGDVKGKSDAGDQGHGEMSRVIWCWRSRAWEMSRVSLMLEIKGMGDVKGKSGAGDQGHGRCQG